MPTMGVAKNKKIIMLKSLIKYLSIILIALICPENVFGQMSSHQADSLENLLPNADDTTKIDLYNKLSMYYRHNNSNKGMEYALLAVNIAEDINDYYRIIKSYNTLGINQRNANFLMQSLDNFKFALFTAQNNNIDSLVGFCANNVARLCLETNHLDSAK